MKKILVSLSIIGIVAVIAVGATVAYFDDTETSTGNTLSAGILDLKIKDNDETWKDGVTATWIASDVKPGDQYAFLVPLIQLAKTAESIEADHLEITSDFAVIEEEPCIEPDTDCNTDEHPEEMAKEMEITRCVYLPGVGGCINCLDGKKYFGYDLFNQVCTGSVLEGPRDDWKIEDQNSDGKISFYDLKEDELDNLPPVENTASSNFEMGVKFSEGAGNDFQGDTFDLTMIFTLNQDASQ